MTRPAASYIWALVIGSMIEIRLLLALTLSNIVLTMPSQPVQAEAKVTPDYSEVTSREKAQALEAKGELVKILLFPEEFGGSDTPENVVYVPKAAADAKDLITETLVRFFKEGLIDNLQVEPTYKGDSFIPSRLVMKTSHSTKEGKFNPTIEVW